MINILFIILMVLGVLIVYPVTPRFFPDTRKFWVTFGSILVHIGAYGLLWQYVSPIIFASLLLFELGVFTWWDPFVMVPAAHKKTGQLISLTLMGAAVVVSLSFFTNFPFWLWGIPLILALIPYLLPPMAKYSKPLLALSITLVLIYLGIIGLNAYRLISPAKSKTPEKKVSETMPEALPQITQIPEEIPLPAVDAPQPLLPSEGAPTLSQPSGPVTEAIQNIDKRIKELEDENARLKTEIETVRKDNVQLRESITAKNKQIDEMRNRIEGVKETVKEL